MSKQRFTTRIDADVLAFAARLAADERRSVTAIMEIAVIEYGERRGLSLAPQQASDDEPPT